MFVVKPKSKKIIENLSSEIEVIIFTPSSSIKTKLLLSDNLIIKTIDLTEIRYSEELEKFTSNVIKIVFRLYVSQIYK